MRAQRTGKTTAVALTPFCLTAPGPAQAEIIDISALAGRPFDQTFFADQGLVFTPVPEPGSLLLLLSGGGGVLWRRAKI